MVYLKVNLAFTISHLVWIEKTRLQKNCKVRNWVFRQLANNVYISASCHLCMLVNDEYRVSYWICWRTSGTLIQNIQVRKTQTEKCANTAIIILEIPISYHIYRFWVIRYKNVLCPFMLYFFQLVAVTWLRIWKYISCLLAKRKYVCFRRDLHNTSTDVVPISEYMIYAKSERNPMTMNRHAISGAFVY